MNNKYLETDKNKYLVLDENKNISLVNSDIDAREVLNLENDLERLETDYKKLTDTIKNEKEFLKTKGILDCGMIIIHLFFALVSTQYIPVIIFSYIFMKGLTTLGMGTNKYNKKKLSENEVKEKEMKEELDEITNKLAYKKEKYNYKKTNIIDFIEENYCLKRDYLRDKPMSYMSKDAVISHEGNKVKKLVKRPDIK